MRFQNVKGTKDFTPKEAAIFQKLIDIIRKNFERYGFTPLITPGVESFELLSAKGGLGEAVKDEIYYFKDKAGREIGLRFDLTMPLARFVVSNPNIPLPFKRYQIDRVWRYDNPQSMRYREFWQADIDIIGTNSVEADIECLSSVNDIFEEIGIKNFVFRINDRVVVEQVLEKSYPKNSIPQILRIIDKLDKIGMEGVKNEIKKTGMATKHVEELLSIKGNNDQKLKEIEDRYGVSCEKLRQILSRAKSLGYANKVEIDFSVVRGLEYYTGLVFEIGIRDGNTKVSFGGGGRYDKLIKILGAQDVPATGISLGLSRLFVYVLEKGLLKAEAPAKVFVATVKDDMKKEAEKIVKALRGAGINVDWNIAGKKLSKQFEYANALDIPYVVIIGEQEKNVNKLKLRDMKTGKEEMVTLEVLMQKMKG